MVEVNCFVCKTSIKIYKYRLKKTKRFFCTECYKTERKKILASYIPVGQKASWKKMREKGLTNAQLKGLALGRYKGKKMSQEGIEKLKKAWKEGKHIINKNVRKGLSTRWGKEEKSPHWKGDSVGYGALHEWVYRNKGKPNKCEHCNQVFSQNRLHWANKSQEYKRDLNDWLRLCVTCHKKYDSQF